MTSMGGSGRPHIEFIELTSLVDVVGMLIGCVKWVIASGFCERLGIDDCGTFVEGKLNGVSTNVEGEGMLIGWVKSLIASWFWERLGIDDGGTFVECKLNGVTANVEGDGMLIGWVKLLVAWEFWETLGIDMFVIFVEGKLNGVSTRDTLVFMFGSKWDELQLVGKTCVEINGVKMLWVVIVCWGCSKVMAVIALMADWFSLSSSGNTEK